MPFNGTLRVSDALREARRLIVERGWCKGVTTDPAGRICLFQAIREATRGWDGNPLYGLVCERIKIFIGGDEISPWNDADERTEGEVIALLDQVIAWGDTYDATFAGV